MKKIFAILALSTGVIYNTNAQVRFAPEAGVNLNMGKYDPNPGSSKMTVGLKVGVAVDLAISNNFSIQPGVYYSMKGSKTEASFLGISVDQSLKLSYIDIPVMAMYNFNVGAGKLFVGVGPNIGIGVSAKEKISALGTDTTADVGFGSDSTQLKMLDFGANVNVGYELPMGLFFRVGYNIGLANLSNLDGLKYKNMGLGISVGYFFGKKD
jgi:hypothetical protein